MMRVKQAIYKTKYRNVVTAIFFLSIVACGVGSVILSTEYFAVYDTANHFSPRITRFAKSAPSPNTRLLIIELHIDNNGSRLLHVFGYGIIVYLNGHQVAQQDTYNDIFLLPGQEITLIIRLDVTGNYAQQIIDAEQSGEWNWFIRHPMRLYVGGWLYLVMAHLATPWLGIEEV